MKKKSLKERLAEKRLAEKQAEVPAEVPVLENGDAMTRARNSLRAAYEFLRSEGESHHNIVAELLHIDGELELDNANRYKSLIEDLKIFYGIPPHDGFNPCQGDGIFAKSIVNKHGRKHNCKDLEELQRKCGFNEIKVRWETTRRNFQ